MACNAPLTIHRHSTRLKLARVANVLQLEHKQSQRHIPVTMPFLADIENPPNQLKHKDLIKTPDEGKWKRGLCNEIGRLGQGHRDVKGRDTIFFIPKSEVLKGKKVTCARMLCYIRPHKNKTRVFRITSGGSYQLT